MLTAFTCLTVTCDGCHAVAETDDGAPCHFPTEAEAREWLALDPDATIDDDQDRWLFGDGTHLCPACQCTAHGHVTTRPGVLGEEGPAGLYLAAVCLRCGRWLELHPTGQDVGQGDPGNPVGQPVGQVVA